MLVVGQVMKFSVREVTGFEACRTHTHRGGRIGCAALPADVATPKLHADDTPVPVLDPGRGETKTGRLWTYVRDDRPAGSHDPPVVLFRYSQDRRGERPREHFKQFTGILQADAYSGFSVGDSHRQVLHRTYLL